MQRRGRSRGARRCYHPRVPAAPPSGTPLPAAFRRRMEGLLGDEAAALFDARGRRPVVGLRVNTLRGPVATLAARLPWPLEALPWCEEGFVVAAPRERGIDCVHSAGTEMFASFSGLIVGD